MLAFQTRPVIASAIVLLCVATGNAQKWGALKGRFVVEGTPATVSPLGIDKLPAFLEKAPPNETLVVSKKGELANAVVNLRVPLNQQIEVAAAYEARLKAPAVLDCKDGAFRPHILAVRRGQQLKIINSDPVGLNVNVRLLSVNSILQPNQTRLFPVNTVSPVPFPIDSNVHPWMRGYLFSLTHPYVAVSANDGTFEIKDIPAGTHEFQFWHELPGYLKRVTFASGRTDARGRAKIQIDPDHTTDLGEIKIDAGVLR